MGGHKAEVDRNNALQTIGTMELCSKNDAAITAKSG